MRVLSTIFILVLINAVTTRLTAQDIIVLRNGDEIQARVTEVGQSEIKYHKYDNPTGPVYSVKKSEVFMIRYQNGTKDVFQEERSPVVAQQGNQGTKPKASVSSRDVQRARGSATFGYIIAAPILLLGVGAATADSFDDGIALGAAATVIGGIGIPVVAGGPRRTRSNTGVDGSPGLRVAGWISYGIAMADAIALLALSGAEVDTGAAATPIAVLGCAAAIFMAADASQTSQQAKALQAGASLRKIKPFLGASRDPFGKSYSTIGLTIKL